MEHLSARPFYLTSWDTISFVILVYQKLLSDSNLMLALKKSLITKNTGQHRGQCFLDSTYLELQQ